MSTRLSTAAVHNCNAPSLGKSYEADAPIPTAKNRSQTTAFGHEIHIAVHRSQLGTIRALRFVQSAFSVVVARILPELQELTMHHVIARIVAQPGAAGQMAEVLAELARATRTEPGCTSYDVFEADGQPSLFYTVEVWKDKAAADAHMTTPHVAAAFAKAGALLAAPPEILHVKQI